MFEKYKKIIISVVALIALFFVYNIFIKPSDPDQGLFARSGQTGNRENAIALGREIISALDRIKAIQIDTSVFDHPVLNRLVDKTNIITPQPRGRSNPFAPIGVDSGDPSVMQGSDQVDNSDEGEQQDGAQGEEADSE